MKLLLTAVTALMIGLACSSVASAKSINVTTFADDYEQGAATCSLREAITAANDDKAISGCTAGDGADQILLPAGVYKITKEGQEVANKAGDFNITGDDDLTIAPASQTAKVQIDAGQKDRAFNIVSSGTATLKSLSITSGEASKGGGVFVWGAGPVVIDSSAIIDNKSEWGGGIGINDKSDVTIINSTIHSNTSNGDGGGVAVDTDGTLTVRNSTIVNNLADANLDGTGNGGGLGTSPDAGKVKVGNTILALNKDLSPDPKDKAPDCATNKSFFPRYVLTSGQKVGEGSCQVGFNPGSNKQVDPKLGKFDYHGGNTPSWSLASDSPAIDAGGKVDPDKCTEVDQRGKPRNPLRCDIGAHEVQDLNVLVIHPLPPTNLATDPAVSGPTTTPKVKGIAPVDTTVMIFSTADCSGAPLASGTAAQFAAGVPVQVAKGSTTTFRAIAKDKAENYSICSNSSAVYTQKDEVGERPDRHDPGPTATVATFDGVNLHVRLKCPARFKPKCVSRAVPVTAKGFKKVKRGKRMVRVPRGKAMAKVKKVVTRSGKWVRVTFVVKPVFRARIQAMTKVDARRLVVRQKVRSKRIGKRKNRKQTTIFHTYKVRSQG